MHLSSLRLCLCYLPLAPDAWYCLPLPASRLWLSHAVLIDAMSSHSVMPFMLLIHTASSSIMALIQSSNVPSFMITVCVDWWTYAYDWDSLATSQLPRHHERRSSIVLLNPTHVLRQYLLHPSPVSWVTV